MTLQFISDPPWKENEKTLYIVKQRNEEKDMEEIGSLTFVLSEVHEIEGMKIFNIQSETKMFRVNFSEKTNLITNAKTFRPIFYNSSILAPTGQVIIKGEYLQSEVKVSILTLGTLQKHKLRFSGEIYDNVEIFHILRSLRLNNFQKNKFTIVNLNALAKTLAEIEFIGIETVEISLGSFECYRMKLNLPDFPNGKQFFLYNKYKPHFLIKNIKGPQIIELINVSNG